MKFNNIANECLLLFLAGDALSLLMYFIRRIKDHRLFIMKELYLDRILLFASQNMPAHKLLQELYLSIKDKGLKKIIFKAMGMADYTKAIDYITGRLYAYHIYVLNDRIKSNIKENARILQMPDAVLAEYNRIAGAWRSDRKRILRLNRRKQISLYIKRLFILLINVEFYRMLKSDIVLVLGVFVYAFGLVETIAVNFSCSSMNERSFKKPSISEGITGAMFQMAVGTAVITDIVMVSVRYLRQAI